MSRLQEDFWEQVSKPYGYERPLRHKGAQTRFGGLFRSPTGTSAPCATRALKRDLAALEKDMSPVTLASEAREAARASNARRGNVPQRDRGQSR